jgi:hypothetical protein
LKREYISTLRPNIESFLASPARVDRLMIDRVWGPLMHEPAAYLFPGVLVLILAAAGLWRARLRPGAVAFYLLLALLSTWMFVAWPFELWRYVYWLPGFNFIRVPSRFIIMTMLALAVLAGAGVDRIAAMLPQRARLAAALTIAALLLAEYSSYPFASVPYRVEIPAIDRWLDTQPKPFVVAEVPMPSSGDLGAYVRHNTMAMLHATAHRQKTIHGYSGIQRPLHDQLYAELTGFPNAESLSSLRGVGVTYVVVHANEYGNNWRNVEAQIANTPALKLEHVEGDGRVYSLLPR